MADVCFLVGLSKGGLSVIQPIAADPDHLADGLLSGNREWRFGAKRKGRVGAGSGLAAFGGQEAIADTNRWRGLGGQYHDQQPENAARGQGPQDAELQPEEAENGEGTQGHGHPVD